MLRPLMESDGAMKFLAAAARQMPFAISKGINDTAYAASTAVVNVMKTTLDRPNPYTLKAMRVDRSDKGNLVAYVGLRDDSPSKGTNYRDALGHLFTGGPRKIKKSEGALVRKGQFQGGKGFLGLGSGAPVDSYGNIPRSTIVQLMSYFSAFKENGYKANMTDKNRAKLAKGKKIVGPPTSPYKTINGVVYFMSRGKGHFVGQGKGWAGGRNQPLAAGIYAKTGIHGSTVKPIMTAIKQPTYSRLINLPNIVGEVVRRDFGTNMTAALKMALRTAR